MPLVGNLDQRIVEPLKKRRQTIAKACAGRGYHGPAPWALEQLNIEVFFQLPNLTAHGAMSHPQFVSRRRHPAEARRCFEGAQGVQRVRPTRSYVSFRHVDRPHLSLDRLLNDQLSSQTSQ
jgi:hypothetical protein